MRDFDTLQSVSAEVVICGNQALPNGQTIGAVDTYEWNRDGWEHSLIAGTGGYTLTSIHETKVAWTPHLLNDIAILPMGQMHEEGRLPEAAHENFKTVYETDTYAVNQSMMMEQQIWSTEKIPKDVLENAVWNGVPIGSLVMSDDSTAQASGYLNKNTLEGVLHPRHDMILAGRLRQWFSSSSLGDGSYGFSSPLASCKDSTQASNAGMSASIYHYRIIFCRGTVNPNTTSPAYVNPNRFFIILPSSRDILSIALQEVSSDAEWGTLMARGHYRP